MAEDGIAEHASGATTSADLKPAASASNRPVGKATRSAVVVTSVAVVMNLVLDVGTSGFYATFGVFILLVLSDFQGPLRSRFLAYVLTGATGLVLIAIGTVVQPHLAAKLVVTLVVVLALAYVTVLRGYVRSAYLSLLLPFIVAVTTEAPLDGLSVSVACYAAGVTVAAVSAVLLWPNRETPAVQRAIAATLTASAKMIAGSPPMRPGATADQVTALMGDVAAANEALGAVFRGKLARPGNLTTQERGLVQLVDDAQRLRYSIRWLSGKATESTPVDSDLLCATHDTLMACAEALNTGKLLPEAVSATLDRARAEHIAKYPDLADLLVSEGKITELIETANASFYARLTSFLTAMAVRHTRFALGQGARERVADLSREDLVTDISRIDGASDPVPLLRSNLTLASPWLRQAIRTAVAVTVAVLIIDLMHLQTGFWVILGIAASLQLTAVGSRKSALWVAVGTVLGFVVCAGLVALIGKNMSALICLLPFVAFLTVWSPSGKYAIVAKQAGFTVWFVMLVSLAGHEMSLAVGDRRLIDVGVGLAVSLVITAVLWPHGVADRVRGVLDESVRSTADYVAAAYTYVTSTMADSDEEAVKQSAQIAVVARARGADAFDVALSEGGADGADAAAWETVANAVDHAFVTATMVSELRSYGLAPLPDETAGAQLRAASTLIAGQFADAIDNEHDRPHHQADSATDAAAIYAANAETAAIETTIRSWGGRTGDLEYAIDGTPFAMSYGRAGTSLLWAQDWLLYFQWMAVHSGARPRR
ncbi:FUSC family protein [Gordonia sp. MP11Mi]|uniref:FUSC family protein n=1 Tax=Gordonia sp. MP11Mi TaxID=3022769 RepID=UPI003B22766A